jgi:hypothetical protein
MCLQRRPRVLFKPTPLATRLLVMDGQDEILRAVLPPPDRTHHRAAPTLCEGLSLWLSRPLSVALFAAEPEGSSGLGLCDGLGLGTTAVYYEVEVLDPRRRAPVSLGSFRDLRQLHLRGVR